MLDALARGILGEKTWHFKRMNGDGIRISIAEHSASNITTVKETRKDKIHIYYFYWSLFILSSLATREI